MDVRVPQLAEGVESGTVVAILVKEGDNVSKEQTLIELETNKAVATIPSPGEGTVSKIHVSEGADVPVGSVIVSLNGEGSSAAPAAPAAAAPAPAPAPTAAPAAAAPAAPVAAPVSANLSYQPQGGEPPAASPSVRKVATQLGLDLTRIAPSQGRSRLVMEDLVQYIQYLQAKAFAEAGDAPAKSAAKPVSVDFSKFGDVYTKKMSRLRKTISAQMTDCWQTIPRITQFEDVSVNAVMALRKKHVEAYKAEGASLTLTTFIIKALGNTLKKHPIFNASLDEVKEEIVFKEYVNLGIAVDTEQGLIVPVIRDIDKKSLLELSYELAELAKKTRDRSVGMEDLQGSSFTLSNQGGIGGTHFTPMVNKPEVGILGVGRGGPKPVVRGKKIVIESMMPVTLSYDHRIVDGGSAARFIVDFSAELQSFSDADVRLGSGKKKASPKKAAKKKSVKKVKKKAKRK